MTGKVKDIIARFALEPHVEGGAFRELYRDGRRSAGREASGVIYYYLGPEEHADFHVLDSDEYWLYHGGAPLEMWMIGPDGSARVELLGMEEGAQPCVLVKGGVIFGARHAAGAQDGTLVSCVTVPEFSYEPYRILSREEMLASYPASEAFWK